MLLSKAIRMCYRKRGFISTGAAKRWNKRKRKVLKFTQPMYVYECDNCGLFHLTKKQPRE